MQYGVSAEMSVPFPVGNESYPIRDHPSMVQGMPSTSATFTSCPHGVYHLLLAVGREVDWKFYGGAVFLGEVG